jgi:hypothetical protein
VETPVAREVRDKIGGINGANKPARTYDAAQCAEECALNKNVKKAVAVRRPFEFQHLEDVTKANN